MARVNDGTKKETWIPIPRMAAVGLVLAGYMDPALKWVITRAEVVNGETIVEKKKLSHGGDYFDHSRCASHRLEQHHFFPGTLEFAMEEHKARMAKSEMTEEQLTAYKNITKVKKEWAAKHRKMAWDYANANYSPDPFVLEWAEGIANAYRDGGSYLEDKEFWGKKEEINPNFLGGIREESCYHEINATALKICRVVSSAAEAVYYGYLVDDLLTIPLVVAFTEFSKAVGASEEEASKLASRKYSPDSWSDKRTYPFPEMMFVPFDPNTR